MNNPPITDEEVAANRAAIDRRPDDAELATATASAICTMGHRIPAGQRAWRYLGRANYDGPPDASVPMFNTMHRAVLWKCLACGSRKGWNSQPLAQHSHTVSQDGGESFTTYDCNYWQRIVELEVENERLRAALDRPKDG